VVTTLFVANTHTPLLFFTTDGMVYKLKTWRLPLGSRTSRGKAIVNILPIEPGTGIAAVMPVDRDEDHWDELQIVFATSAGDVRRNALSGFHQRHAQRQDRDEVARGRKRRLAPDERAHRLDEDDVMLVTAGGPRHPLPTTDVRVFNSAIPPACAASSWPRATRSCRCRSSAISRPQPRNAPPISSSAA
jgi:DNA gyrase subunit A